MNDKQIIDAIILYSEHSDVLDSCNTNPNSYDDLDDFTQQNIDEIYDTYLQNVDICTALELESDACFEDCISYVSPLTLLTNTTTPEQITKILNWYQMGGGPIGWYETGDPDMCSYTEGTYCFTPIQAQQGGFFISLQEHGCCVPGTCVGEDAVKVLQQNLWCYQGYNLTYAQYMFQGFFPITNRCEPIPRDFTSAGFSVVVIIFLIFVLLVVIASIKTQYLTEQRQSELSDNRLHNNDENQQNSVNMNKNIYDNNWFLYCFSIQNTWEIFNRTRPENKSEFNFLDGIRFVSMAWVIWGHVYVYILVSAPSNQAVMIPPLPGSMVPQGENADSYDYVFNQFYMMFAEYGFYSVDSFYYLSGFLAAFSLYRQLNKYDINKAFSSLYIWIPLAYVHRILRLLPMMTFILLIQWFIADQLPYGYKVPSRDANAQLCEDSWYKVLLFYANLGELDDLGCMGHLWYVQCDMQMFLLLPWILLLYKWKPLMGIISSIVPFFICIGLRTFFAFYYDFGANMLAPAYETRNGGDQQQQYFKPWGRMGPYFFGTFTMLIILTVKNHKYEIRSRLIYFSVMILSCFIMACLVFWPWEDVKHAPKQRWSVLNNQIYYALSRPVWGIALGLLSFVLVFKYNHFKSIIGVILSLKIYQPLGKLTYTMYLIHMMIIQWFFNSINISFYYELWFVICIFMAILTITMALTIVLWFVIEQPVANIIGLCMKQLSFKKKSKLKKKNSMDSELANIKMKKKN
eukprot:312345_1